MEVVYISLPNVNREMHFTSGSPHSIKLAQSIMSSTLVAKNRTCWLAGSTSLELEQAKSLILPPPCQVAQANSLNPTVNVAQWPSKIWRPEVLTA